MTQFDPVAALALPPEALIDRRVPKKLLIENGAFAAGDRRRIQEGVEELRWFAALKAGTVGIAEYRDPEREYLEIAVLKLELRSAVRAERIVELVHRAIPYPVLLITGLDGIPELSLAHKRLSLGEAGKTVIDGEIAVAQVSDDCRDECRSAFRKALALSHQPRGNLKDLYQGWMDTVYAFRVAAVTGDFRVPSSAAAASDRREALRQYWHLNKKIENILSVAGAEKQMRRRAELNIELARLRTDREAARARL